MTYFCFWLNRLRTSIFFFFFLRIYLSIIFGCTDCVFVAAPRLPLVAASRDCSLDAVCGLLVTAASPVVELRP